MIKKYSMACAALIAIHLSGNDLSQNERIELIIEQYRWKKEQEILKTSNLITRIFTIKKSTILSDYEKSDYLQEIFDETPQTTIDEIIKKSFEIKTQYEHSLSFLSPSQLKNELKHMQDLKEDPSKLPNDQLEKIKLVTAEEAYQWYLCKKSEHLTYQLPAISYHKNNACNFIGCNYCPSIKKSVWENSSRDNFIQDLIAARALEIIQEKNNKLLKKLFSGMNAASFLYHLESKRDLERHLYIPVIIEFRRFLQDIGLISTISYGHRPLPQWKEFLAKSLTTKLYCQETNLQRLDVYDTQERKSLEAACWNSVMFNNGSPTIEASILFKSMPASAIKERLAYKNHVVKLIRQHYENNMKNIMESTGFQNINYEEICSIERFGPEILRLMPLHYCNAFVIGGVLEEYLHNQAKYQNN